MNIRGAIFDLDGTTIDTLFYWDNLWAKLGEMYLSDKSFRPGLDFEKAVRTITQEETAHLIHNTFGFGDSGEALYEMMYQDLLHMFKYEASFKPGAKELLDHLKARGVKMTIASASMPGLLKVVFDRFNLHQYFPKIISCADVGKGKSHPDVFIAAEKYLGTTRDDTWVFEDSFVALQTAKNAGFQTVGVFDKHNFGSVGVADVSTIYIGEGDSFHRIIEQI